MLEDQVAYLLQKYLGNYVSGLNKEALKISVWQGDVELKNMQLKPEALNALKLPVKVKAGFLGSVKLKVPWSRLGQEPVLVSLDRIFLLAEPATEVEGSSEDAVQEAKKVRIQEMEIKLLEKTRRLKSEVNKSWIGSLISTIIGNLKLSVSNIHIRYEDHESNPGHPFAAGMTLVKLSAVTVDDNGRETFVTGGALERIQKSVELERLALYFDSDICPWYIEKPWETLLPQEWDQLFAFGTKDGRLANAPVKHTYLLQPVTGYAKYFKQQPSEFSKSNEPLQKAIVNLDDVTLCLPKDGYRDILKLANNFVAFNQRLKYAHFRPPMTEEFDPRSWWRYAVKAVSDQMKKASGKLSWEQVLRYASLRKKYISLYASLLKSDPSRAVVDDNNIEELDRGLDIELILQWRMLAHKFVEQSVESDIHLRREKAKKSWWSFRRQSLEDGSEPFQLTGEDWDRLNKIIGYKENDDVQLVATHDKGDALHTFLEVHMQHNASKLITEAQNTLVELSSENLDCSIKLYSEAKIFDVKLGTYKLSSPKGLLAESAVAYDSLVGVFCYKPFNSKVDWSMVAKAAPCYMTYLKDSVDQVIRFFESDTADNQTVAQEAVAAVQMTIDGVKRTAQQQVNRALKDQSRFMLDLDIAAPKVTIPTDFCPDNVHPTKLLLDLGNLVIRTQDVDEQETDIYMEFDLILSDVSAFLVDGDYLWSQTSLNLSDGLTGVNFFPVIDRCGAILKLQQNRQENPSFPPTRLAMRLPSLGFHFSPARYHRLIQVAKIFQEVNAEKSDYLRPWDQADFKGWLSLLIWKGVGNREAVWQRRYFCLVGPFLYVLENPCSKTYKQYISLRGKQVYAVPAEFVGNVEYVLAICSAARSNIKVVEDSSALVLRCDSDGTRRTWLQRLHGAVYRSSIPASINGLSESDPEDSEMVFFRHEHDTINVPEMERLFMTGILDELRIYFSCNYQHDQHFIEMLLAEEHHLFDFKAIGGQVELSIKGDDMFIGMVLNALEIEDLVCCNRRVSEPCYLARSFIGSADESYTFANSGGQSYDNYDASQSEGDNFYEAPENLSDLVDSSTQSPGKFLSPGTSAFEPPTFTHIAGLLPLDGRGMKKEDVEFNDSLSSFVKAQIVIYDQNSPLYNNIDNQVTVTLATLSFFCRRPTVLAVMEFVNAINMDNDSCESSSDNSSANTTRHDISGQDPIDQCSMMVEEPAIKGLLGKGKSRTIFCLTLNMVHAQIVLMNENETKLATVSQDNLHSYIGVFPSSFSIEVSLGNLRISDDSLSSDHSYFWVCDMKDPAGSSFVELIFSSFSVDDEDYRGYEYSLFGQLSEVQIIYLNRFVQEIISYFMGLVHNDSKGVVRLKDQVTNSERWFTTSEIEGSPAVKLDLSLRQPIIVLPRRTDSLEYLKLDIVHIAVENTFEWFSGSKNDINAVHMEKITLTVEDINLNVSSEGQLGESIIQDVKGVSIVVWRSLRDLVHQVPNTEATIKIKELKAALSNREYQIITECALSNFSETPHSVPPLNGIASPLIEASGPLLADDLNVVEIETPTTKSLVSMKVTVSVELVELCLHSGAARDSPLASLQISGAWLLYKSFTGGDSFLSATLKGIMVIDDREGTEEEFRLAVGKPRSIGYGPSKTDCNIESQGIVEKDPGKETNITPMPTMLILDAKFSQLSTRISLCIQRPQLLVTLDFLLALAEFFVPTVGNMLSNEETENTMYISDAVILDQANYDQPSPESSFSPLRPLIADNEEVDHFIYDGKGGTLYLRDRQGCSLSSPSTEAIIFVGSGKKLQFKNINIKNGQFLDSCIFLGSNSSYSALEDDHVYLEAGDEGSPFNFSGENMDGHPSANDAVNRSTEFIIDLQATSPELTFYSTSKGVGESLILSNKLLHAQLDAFCRLVLKGDTVEMSATALGLTMESNGIRIIEPFDTSVKFSNVSGKMNIHVSISNIFLNFTFSILRLFIAVEEDILAFLRRASKKLTAVCTQFDKVVNIENISDNQTYAIWRPQPPPGFAVFGDYLTPLDKPPTKGVVVVNTSFRGIKKPVSFKLIWPPADSSDFHGVKGGKPDNGSRKCDTSYSIWLPEAPEGYVALGCVACQGRAQPPLSSAFCILASLVSPCTLRDCIIINFHDLYPPSVPFWRVDNSIGTFLPADLSSLCLIGRGYELRHILFRFAEVPLKSSKSLDVSERPCSRSNDIHPNKSASINSARPVESVASFHLIWWNQGSSSQKALSIWRPVVPQGMIYFGDIAVDGYEPPTTCTILHDSGGDELFIAPLDFQLVGQVKKKSGIETISFWMPHAPPGYVSLGCVACKDTPTFSTFSALRCIRCDMVTSDKFFEDSLWDTGGGKFSSGMFSIWTLGNSFGTFIVRSGTKRPPKRLAIKLADRSIPSGSDDTVIDIEIGTFSAALFDDYGGLMVPLLNVSLSGVGFSLHGGASNQNSTVCFSLSARSYNDKNESWEPLVEPVDGFLRYQYDVNSLGAASQSRLTSTRDLNLNVSVSSANMIFQAYASWNNLSHVHKRYAEREVFSPAHGGRSMIDIHTRKSYYIIPQNKLGQDIFIRATEIRGLPNVIRMPSGDMKTLQVPVSKNLLDAHLKGHLCSKLQNMLTIIIAEAQFLRVEGLSSHQYVVAVRLIPDESISSGSLLKPQSARTCGKDSSCLSSELVLVNWSEIFFFKVDSPDAYVLELMVIDNERGDSVGFFSAPLNQIAKNVLDDFYDDIQRDLSWIDLSSAKAMQMTSGDEHKIHGRIKCAVLLSSRSDVENSKPAVDDGRKSGFVQISPSKEGPWTTVRLNYAAPAACWRLGNDVVASEVSVKDGNRYVNIRSLVSVFNNTEFTLEVCLVPKTSSNYEGQPLADSNDTGRLQNDDHKLERVEYFETEKYDPSNGWVSCMIQRNHDHLDDEGSNQADFGVELPQGWEWNDDWQLDESSINSADGWVYTPDIGSSKSAESSNPLKCVRQRRWVRYRKQKLDQMNQKIYLGLLKPGDTLPVPLPGLTKSDLYILKVKPADLNKIGEYSWCFLVAKPGASTKDDPQLCVSTLTESEELLYCNQITGTSTNTTCGMWFSMTIQAIEIAKDLHSDSIQDWRLVIKPPLSITNYLPLTAEYSVLEEQTSGHFIDCVRGVFSPGETVKVHNADIRKPLYLSLLPQRGWFPIHEAVLISCPKGVPDKTIGLRSSISGRVAQIFLEQNLDKVQPLLARIIRVYVPYWFTVMRCPPLTYRLVDMARAKQTRKLSLPFHSEKDDDAIFQEITEEEIYDGYTIASALNFNLLGLTVAITQPGSKELFGPVKDLSPLGDMDGSLDLTAYDVNGNCMRLFVSSKPCPYQSVPTKVISVRPFMTFTNRLGEDIFIKLSSMDDMKVLSSSDSRVSFAYRQMGEEADKLQVCLKDTEWSYPFQISKEDTITLVLRKQNGTRRFLRIEIRGYEEGSRFIVVFRVGSTTGPIRIENRTASKTINIRQSGFGDDAWTQIEPHSTTNFSWEDPYGERFLDAMVNGHYNQIVWKLDMEKVGLSFLQEELELQFHILDMKDVKVARFADGMTSESGSHGEIHSLMPGENWGYSRMPTNLPNNTQPIELIVEFGVVGISIVDHRPKELSYLYLERVFISYSSGYDRGATSRLKVLLGHMQVDNQLPLTVMPVLLAPEQTTDMHHPAFKMTITMCNETSDGVQVYPYIYIRATEKCWRLSIHEPIIWAFVDFYNNLHLDRIPKGSNVTQVDPEIRVDLIDVSEVRIKVSLETAPAQRPHGVLGVWSPILSAVGNAFKVQVHLRKVMQKDRFMRRSSVIPAIGNRIWRDLIHNPLHLLFSVDVLGMTSSTLASLSKGFAELSTDGQFLQLRSKQVWSRRITGVGDGIIQGTEAFAQGVAFGVSGVVKKPVESARQNGLLGFAHGIGRAFLGVIVQPVSGALDFFSLAVDGIGASCSRCLEVLTDKTSFQRIRNPRAIRVDGVLREYNEREAVGQMILLLAEASRHFGCTELFKEPSKFAWSDCYEDHFTVPYQKIALVTNKRIMLLQCLAPDKMDKKPCKIIWDVPWEELMAVELAKAGCDRPSHLILHLKSFRRSEACVRVIKCSIEEGTDGREAAQATRICSVVCKMWKSYQSDMKSIMLKVPSSQRHVYFAWSEADGRSSRVQNRAIIKLRDFSSFNSSCSSDERRFVKHSINFFKVWSSEQRPLRRRMPCHKQVLNDGGLCTIWRPICPEGYVSIGDIARVGSHPPNVAAIYRSIDRLFTVPLGYDLVWRNCLDDYSSPVSIWHPRAPEGFVAPGCVAVAGFTEPEPDLVHCVAESIAEEAAFEPQKVWSAPESYPWSCHIYQVESDALHFVALRQVVEESGWKPVRVVDDPGRSPQVSEAQSSC